MFIDKTTRCGKDLIRGFRGGFLENFVMDWSIVNPEEGLLTEEAISKSSRNSAMYVACDLGGDEYLEHVPKRLLYKG